MSFTWPGEWVSQDQKDEVYRMGRVKHSTQTRRDSNFLCWIHEHMDLQMHPASDHDGSLSTTPKHVGKVSISSPLFCWIWYLSAQPTSTFILLLIQMCHITYRGMQNHLKIPSCFPCGKQRKEVQSCPGGERVDQTWFRISKVLGKGVPFAIPGARSS
jgi:hypothetical protein